MRSVREVPSIATDELTGRLLRDAVTQLELQAREGRYATTCIRAVADGARLLGDEGLASRTLRLLQEAPDGGFSHGALASFELPQLAPRWMRTCRTHQEIATEHPVYDGQRSFELIKACATSEPHIGLCLEGQHEEARSVAGSDRALEEMGAALAVLGQFDATLSIARLPTLPGFRQRGILQVLIIEEFRADQCDQAILLLEELEAGGHLDAWNRLHLALGLAGRVPWAGYPFSDW